MSAALGIARTSSALHSLARKFPAVNTLIVLTEIMSALKEIGLQYVPTRGFRQNFFTVTDIIFPFCLIFFPVL